MKCATLIIRITPDQDALLKKKARSAGFIKKSDFVRFALFKDEGIDDKINAIYQKVVKNGS